VICSTNDAGPAVAQTCNGYMNENSVWNVGPFGITGSYPIDPDGAGAISTFDAWCDQLYQGGGWTMIESSNGVGPINQTEGMVARGTSTYLPAALMQAVAAPGVSGQVHIRTQDQEATRSITTTPDSLPIQNLRALKTLEQGNWSLSDYTGPMADSAHLSWTCDTSAAHYPAIYWPCGNFNGLHLENDHSRWTFIGPDEPMEVYVR